MSRLSLVAWWMAVGLCAFAAFQAAHFAVPAPVEAAGCVTWTEYRRLPVNGTLTPAAVQRRYGARGHQVSQCRVVERGIPRWYTRVWFPACRDDRSAFVTFKGWRGHPAVAVRKAYR